MEINEKTLNTDFKQDMMIQELIRKLGRISFIMNKIACLHAIGMFISDYSV